MGLIFKALSWVVVNKWARTCLLVLLAISVLIGSSNMVNDKTKYKKGPQPYSLEQPSAIEYGYFTLTALSTGEYLTLEEGVLRSLHRTYTLFYPVYSREDFGMTFEGKSHPTAFVKQKLSVDEAKCIDKHNCLQTGSVNLTGRITHDSFNVKTNVISIKDHERGLGPPTIMDKLLENYNIDNKTLFIDTEWKPSTVDVAFEVSLFGWVILAAAVVSFAIPLLTRRRV